MTILFGTIFSNGFCSLHLFHLEFGPLALSLATGFLSEWWGQLADRVLNRLEIGNTSFIT